MNARHAWDYCPSTVAWVKPGFHPGYGANLPA
jgi:hypothetical protein